jgi:hypothetical protein
MNEADKDNHSTLKKRGEKVGKILGYINYLRFVFWVKMKNFLFHAIFSIESFLLIIAI